jgi:hypothetical protein
MLTLAPLNLPSVAHACAAGDADAGAASDGAAEGAVDAGADAATDAAGDGVADCELQADSTRTKPTAGAIAFSRLTQFLLLTHPWLSSILNDRR